MNNGTKRNQISVTDHFVVRQHREWFASPIISAIANFFVVLFCSYFDVVAVLSCALFRIVTVFVGRRLCILNTETWDATFDPSHTATKQQVL